MNQTLKWILIILGILIFIGLIILLVFYLRSTSPVVITNPGETPTSPTGPPPLTFKNCDDRNKYCRNQCYGKIIIPGAGVTAALKCLDECKRSNPC